MRRWFWTAIGLLLVLGGLGFLVAASGIIPINASSGHWAATAWLLHFSMKRSVSTHSTPIDELMLDEPWLELKGAGTYELGCRPCHGAPDLRSPRIARAMTPPPPDLAPLIDSYRPEELFYIVKHGVKFTGMPAWPALERDDEVRAVVAFLLKMPKLDAEAYRRLVHGEPIMDRSAEPLRDVLGDGGVPRAVFESCARCHGSAGQGREVAAFPKLAGQRREYFVASMEAYARGERHSGIMEPLAAAMDAAEIQKLADYYGGIPARAPSESASMDADRVILRGREIALRGVPSQGVPSCMDCHGPEPARRNPFYPELAGQFADYLVLQLELFKTGRRGGTAYAHLMSHVATRLNAEQMRDVALYYASLPAARAVSER